MSSTARRAAASICDLPQGVPAALRNVQSLQSTDCRLCFLPDAPFFPLPPACHFPRGTGLLPIVIVHKFFPVVFCAKPLLNRGPLFCYTYDIEKVVRIQAPLFPGRRGRMHHANEYVSYGTQGSVRSKRSAPSSSKGAVMPGSTMCSIQSPRLSPAFLFRSITRA